VRASGRENRASVVLFYAIYFLNFISHKRSNISAVKTVGFQSFILGFDLPKTTGKSDVRQSILDYIKTFISNIDVIRDFDVTIKKREISVASENFGVFFDSTRTFKMGFATEEEKALETINDIMNQISEKLNGLNKKNAKSQIFLAYTLAYELDKKIKPFSRLVRKEALEELSQTGMNFVPIKMNLFARTEEKANKIRGSQITINARGKTRVLEIDLANAYRDQFPIDITKKAFRVSTELLNRILKILGGDE
jgi:hypothetical protein